VKGVPTLRGGLLLALLVAVATRLAWLDADPALFKHAAELVDEGYWAHNARAAVVLGRPFPDDLAQAAATAPLFHRAIELAFRAFGVGFASLRLVSALSSAALVPLMMVLVAPLAGPRAALLAGVLVLAEHELFAFGRLGMPESLQLLLAVAGAAAWLHRRTTAWSVAAGVLFGLATLAKMNVIVAAGFAGMWGLEAVQHRPRLARDVLGFAGGALVIVAAWIVAGYVPHAALFGLNNVALNRDRLALAPSDLGRLPLHFVDSRFWGLPSTFLLGALAVRRLTTLVHGFRDGWRAGVMALTPLDTLALGWSLGMVVPTALLVRAVGERRILILVVPLAVLAALGLTARATPAPSERAPRTLCVALAAAATIVALTVAFTAGHGNLFWSGGALAALGGGVAMALALDRLAAGGVLSGAGAWCGIVLIAALVPAVNLGRFADWATPIPGWLAALVGIVAIGAMLGVERRAGAWVVLAAYLVWGTLAIGLTLARPTYTLRDASIALGALTRPGDVVAGAFAHPLALENRTHPLWYTPARPFNQLLNADLERFPVRWVLTMDGSGWPRASQYPFPLARARTFDLLPAPRGGVKVRLELYRRGP
jgi:4-amino-4-deoxy-L-arabinose transferase-like glycosyltransferase